MANIKGGRPKGSGSAKRHLEANELVAKLGCSPLEILCHIANGDWKKLGYEKPTEVVSVTKQGDLIERDIITLQLRYSAASDVCSYLYARRKAVEHSGTEGEPIKLQVVYETEFGSSNEDPNTSTNS